MDNAKLIVDTCVKYELLPAKRTTPADRNKVSKFKKDLMNSNQPNKKVMIDLCLELIKDKSQLNDNIETNYKQEFKDIMNSKCYLNKSTEDICVCLSNRSRLTEQNRKNAVEDLYNEREESKRIIAELRKKNQILSEENQLKEKTNNFLIDQLEKYDSDYEEEEPELDYDELNMVSSYHDKLTELSEILNKRDETIQVLTQQLSMSDYCEEEEEEEEEEAAAEEAKQWIEKLAAENEAKRGANRKRFK